MPKRAIGVQQVRRLAIPSRVPTSIVGTLVGFDDGGQALVDYPNNVNGPLHARTIMDATQAPAKGAKVLLAFENDDPELPIMLGVPSETPLPAANLHSSHAVGDDVTFTVRRLVIDAGLEITLRCGQSSVVIRKDGTVVIRGTNLLSRSSGANRIKGATVRIN